MIWTILDIAKMWLNAIYLVVVTTDIELCLLFHLPGWSSEFVCHNGLLLGHP